MCVPRVSKRGVTRIATKANRKPWCWDGFLSYQSRWRASSTATSALSWRPGPIPLRKKPRTAAPSETLPGNGTRTGRQRKAKKHAVQVMTRLEADVFPETGDRPIVSLTASDFRRTVQSIEARGAAEVCQAQSRGLRPDSSILCGPRLPRTKRGRGSATLRHLAAAKKTKLPARDALGIAPAVARS